MQAADIGDPCLSGCLSQIFLLIVIVINKWPAKSFVAKNVKFFYSALGGRRLGWFSSRSNNRYMKRIMTKCEQFIALFIDPCWH